MSNKVYKVVLDLPTDMKKEVNKLYNEQKQNKGLRKSKLCSDLFCEAVKKALKK